MIKSVGWWNEEAFLQNDLFNPTRVGIGIRRAFTPDNDDQAYQAIMSATKSAIAAARLFDQSEESRQQSTRSITENGTACIALPAIVIDGPLYEYSLDSDGEFILTEREMSWALHRLLEPYRTVPIPVVTKPYLSKFLEKAQRTADYLCNAWVTYHT